MKITLNKINLKWFFMMNTWPLLIFIQYDNYASIKLSVVFFILPLQIVRVTCVYLSSRSCSVYKCLFCQLAVVCDFFLLFGIVFNFSSVKCTSVLNCLWPHFESLLCHTQFFMRVQKSKSFFFSVQAFVFSLFLRQIAINFQHL